MSSSDRTVPLRLDRACEALDLKTIRRTKLTRTSLFK
jgi:hypothetical protein